MKNLRLFAIYSDQKTPPRARDAESGSLANGVVASRAIIFTGLKPETEEGTRHKFVKRIFVWG